LPRRIDEGREAKRINETYKNIEKKGNDQITHLDSNK
jgi:hypothetical protein